MLEEQKFPPDSVRDVLTPLPAKRAPQLAEKPTLLEALTALRHVSIVLTAAWILSVGAEMIT